MEQDKQKQRVAVYCRVSTDSGEPCFGCAAQETYYTELIGKNPNWDLVGIYTDQGITSGDWKNRREFKKMIAACERGDIDIIIVKSISRLARSVLECLKTIRNVKAYGVNIIFEKENVDTFSDSSELFITLFGELARSESESLSQNLIYPVPQRV